MSSGLWWTAVAKDTEKLIRQLSLIASRMAERRPVTATEIRRDVEGYSDMTEDAFARRFYADRAELDALGIHLSVDNPADGAGAARRRVRVRRAAAARAAADHVGPALAARLRAAADDRAGDHRVGG